MADVLTLDPSQPSRIPDILRRTVPWVRMMSVVLFISCAVMMVGGVIFSIAMAAGLAAQGGGTGRPFGAAPALIGGLFYAGMGLINIFPAVFLWRFGSRAKEYVASPRPELLEQALDSQRSYWKFMGIFMVIAVVLALVMVCFAFVGGLLWYRATAAR
jgi:hypothetical protein